MSWGVATQNGVSVSLASIVSLSCGATEFSPIDLFTGGTVGAWYDPSDTSTLFQDSAGTTPVTAVEQPVGLMLDKSQGLVLGPELITDAADRTFTSDTGWWTKGGSATIGSGKCTLTTGSWIQRLNLTTSGRWYVIEYDLTVRSGALYLTGYFSLTNSSTSGRKKFYIYATTGTFRPVVDSGDVDITNITIKELPGNHASQATSTSRPVLRARYNQLTYSEQFDNAAWSKSNTTVTANAVAAPDATTTADKLVSSATTSTHYAAQVITLVASTNYSASVYVKAAEYGWAIVYIGTVGVGRYINLSSGAVGSAFIAAPTSTTVTDAGNGWWRVVVVFNSGANTSADIRIYGTTADATSSYLGDGTSGIYIWGADLRTGSSAGTYQRIAAATDYATAGFLPYLYFVTDDNFATGNINFTGTDKMSTVTGLTKLSDASAGILVELSTTASNAGAFGIQAPNSSTNSYRVESCGSLIQSANATGYAAPITNVLSGLMNISGDSIIIRVNGTQVTNFIADQGTGNYGNYPLYIGRRAGSALPFNGNLYGLIVCGKTLSASELSATEAWMATKTGVTL